MNQAQAELPHLSIVVAADRTLSLTLDGKPYTPPTGTGSDPWAPARDLATTAGMSVFAQVTDNGTTYAEIVTPTPPHAPAPPREPVVATPRPGGPFTVAGDGFTPGEDVYIAVVVSTRPARFDGVAELPLPGALLGRMPGVLIMFGLDSQSLIVADPTAAPQERAT
ncbi:MAG: hypothetical protein ACTMIR_07570 [Cellulomonadaceae bacterium]